MKQLVYFFLLAITIQCSNPSSKRETKIDLTDDSEEVTNSLDTCRLSLINLIKENNYSEINELLKNGCSPNPKAKVSILDYPLFHAIKNKNVELVRLLLRYRANPNIPENGFTLFHYASGNSTYDIVNELLIADGNPNSIHKGGSYPTPLISAVGSNSPEIVELLLNYGAEVHPDTSYLHIALIEQSIWSENARIMELILDAGVHLGFKWYTGYGPVETSILHQVAGLEKDSSAISIIDLLLDRGAEINIKAEGRTPIESNARHGHHNVIKHLIMRGANIGNAINYAAMGRNLETIRFLLESGANPNNNDSITYLPLIGATFCCGHNDGGEGPPPFEECKATLELLLDFGANPNLSVKYGKSLLEHAHERQMSEVIELCKSYGYEVKTSNKH